MAAFGRSQPGRRPRRPVHHADLDAAAQVRRLVHGLGGAHLNRCPARTAILSHMAGSSRGTWSALGDRSRRPFCDRAGEHGGAGERAGTSLADTSCNGSCNEMVSSGDSGCVRIRPEPQRSPEWRVLWPSSTRLTGFARRGLGVQFVSGIERGYPAASGRRSRTWGRAMCFPRGPGVRWLICGALSGGRQARAGCAR